MALNVGDQFQQRWLATPDAVRQTFCDELNHICELLLPDTQIQKWQYQDALLQQKHRQVIERAYVKLKMDIIEAQKRQRQDQLEKTLEKKRAEEQAFIARLEELEQQKQLDQTAYLRQFAQQLQEETFTQNTQKIVKYDSRQATNFDRSQTVEHSQSLPSSISDDLKTRLELEAEYYIDQTLHQLRIKLKAAAQEEIELILSHQITTL